MIDCIASRSECDSNYRLVYFVYRLIFLFKELHLTKTTNFTNYQRLLKVQNPVKHNQVIFMAMKFNSTLNPHPSVDKWLQFSDNFMTTKVPKLGLI